MERLKHFQHVFEEKEHKYISYHEGEKLYGLPITPFPELQKTKEDLKLLDVLYSLYMTVVQSVNSFKENSWRDVAASLDHMNHMISEFSTKCKRLPKQLRVWQAFEELRQTITDIQEAIPVLEQLVHPAIRPRHWRLIMQAANCQLAFESEGFKLCHVMDNGVVTTYKQEVGDICTAAAKEMQVRLFQFFFLVLCSPVLCL